MTPKAPSAYISSTEKESNGEFQDPNTRMWLYSKKGTKRQAQAAPPGPGDPLQLLERSTLLRDRKGKQLSTGSIYFSQESITVMMYRIKVWQQLPVGAPAPDLGKRSSKLIHKRTLPQNAAGLSARKSDALL